jgi:hypothetical protein
MGVLIDNQERLTTPKMSVKMGMKMTGASRATTLPANMGF